MTASEERLSRALNACMGGDPREMFCSAAYRRRWTSPRWFVVWIALDLHFWSERREWRHCRKRWLEHEARQDRARELGVGAITERAGGPVQPRKRFPWGSVRHPRPNGYQRAFEGNISHDA